MLEPVSGSQFTMHVLKPRHLCRNSPQWLWTASYNYAIIGMQESPLGVSPSWAISHDHAAVNVEGLARDVGCGGVCGQELDQAGDLLRLPIPLCCTPPHPSGQAEQLMKDHALCDRTCAA